MRHNIKKTLYISALVLLPLVSYSAPQNFKDAVGLFTEIIKSLSLVAASLALLAFFWGIVLFITRSGESDNLEKAKSTMGWGLFALFILVSFWGIIRVIEVTFIS